MLGCGYLPFNSSQYMRYTHQMIIHHIGKVIGGILISFNYDRISFILGNIVMNLTINNVIQWFGELLQFETYTEGGLFGQVLLNFRG